MGGERERNENFNLRRKGGGRRGRRGEGGMGERGEGGGVGEERRRKSEKREESWVGRLQ